jgi:hypothetical protein
VSDEKPLCEWCGKPFSGLGAQGRPRRTCTDDCKYALRSHENPRPSNPEKRKLNQMERQRTRRERDKSAAIAERNRATGSKQVCSVCYGLPWARDPGGKPCPGRRGRYKGAPICGGVYALEPESETRRSMVGSSAYMAMSLADA